ncbi:MAG: 50S ribosomal protein L17 [Candidatus Campbellbacteria bacterium]|nr:50S ribosomal protein L17 [Candidatus Campbellbacteria bacterium]
MRHHSKIRTLGRTRSQRRDLLRSLANSLIKHGRITTTQAKAKELRPYVEKMVTKAKSNDDNKLATKRLLLSRLNNEDAVKKLESDIGPRYKDRDGGYTRILKLPRRSSDGAEMAIIEFV